MGILLLVVALVLVSAALFRVGRRFYRGRKPRPAVQEIQDDTSGR